MAGEHLELAPEHMVAGLAWKHVLHFAQRSQAGFHWTCLGYSDLLKL